MNITIDGRNFRSKVEAVRFYRTTRGYIDKALRENTIPEFDKHKREWVEDILRIKVIDNLMMK